MADDKPKWMDYLAISTVLIAVCATLSTFKGGGYSTKSLLNQAKASDQWALYQSKSIKSYIYDLQKENLELQISAGTNKSNKHADSVYTAKAEGYAKKVTKYSEEKEQIKKEAENYEQVRDEAKKHSERFGLAVIFLQVSILLSSIAALAKQKTVWLLSMAIGVVGIAYFLNGFFLLW